MISLTYTSSHERTVMIMYFNTNLTWFTMKWSWRSYYVTSLTDFQFVGLILYFYHVRYLLTILVDKIFRNYAWIWKWAPTHGCV